MYVCTPRPIYFSRFVFFVSVSISTLESPLSSLSVGDTRGMQYTRKTSENLVQFRSTFSLNFKTQPAG